MVYLDTQRPRDLVVQVSGPPHRPSTTSRSGSCRKKIAGAKKQTRRVNIGPTNKQTSDAGGCARTCGRRTRQDPTRHRPESKGRARTRGEDVHPSRGKEKYFIAKKKLSDGSKRTYGQIDRHLADWLDKPLSDITADMVEERHQKIADDIAKGKRYDGRATANATMVTLRVFWRWAAKRVNLPPSPLRRMQEDEQWFPAQRRTTRVPAR